MHRDTGGGSGGREWGTLDRGQMVAALAITRRKGVAALSMRRLAAEISAGLLTYPDFADRIIATSGQGHARPGLSEEILRVLVDSGLPETRVPIYHLVFVDMVIGRAHRQIHGDPTSTDEVFETELDMLVDAIERSTTPSG